MDKLTPSQVKAKFPWINTDDVALATYGKYDFEFGKLIIPLAYMCDDDDSLLIGDYLNRRLQLLHEEKWSTIKLQPPPRLTSDAVSDGCAFYVFDIFKSQLFKIRSRNGENSKSMCLNVDYRLV